MQLSPRASRHLEAIQRAIDCAELGARVRTIRCVTGLPPRMLQRLLFTESNAIPRGRAPDSPEWYHGANLLYRTDASLFAAVYQRLRRFGFGSADALTGGYRYYLLLTASPSRISFDRAFDLASHIDGIWVAKSASFEVIACAHCASEFLVSLGTVASAASCPFCKLTHRYRHDPRVQSAYPVQPLPHPNATPTGWRALQTVAAASSHAQAQAANPRAAADACAHHG